MSPKIKRIIWIVLTIIPSAMLVMSAFMKLSHAPDLVQGMTQIGYGNYITALGIVELISVALFLIPQTYKLGFLLVCGYLGGALAIEIGGGKPPVAAALLALVWIAVFLRNKDMFLVPAKS